MVLSSFHNKFFSGPILTAQSNWAQQERTPHTLSPNAIKGPIFNAKYRMGSMEHKKPDWSC